MKFLRTGLRMFAVLFICLEMHDSYAYAFTSFKSMVIIFYRRFRSEYHLKSDLKCVQYCVPDGLFVYNINKLVLQSMVF